MLMQCGLFLRTGSVAGLIDIQNVFFFYGPQPVVLPFGSLSAKVPVDPVGAELLSNRQKGGVDLTVSGVFRREGGRCMHIGSIHCSTLFWARKPNLCT